MTQQDWTMLINDSYQRFLSTTSSQRQEMTRHHTTQHDMTQRDKTSEGARKDEPV